MKRCDYCGKEGEDVLDTCTGCGTPFPIVQPLIAEPSTVPPIIPKPILNASKATQVFILMFVGQVLGAMIGGALAVAAAAMHGVDLTDRQQTAQLVNRSPLTLGVAGIATALATVAASILLVRPALKDRTSSGAAWAIGSGKDLGVGFAVGILVALGACLVNGLFSLILHPQFGPLTTMGQTHGIPQITYILLAVVIMPAPEELLYRGVLYGGFFQSFGHRKAAIISTTVFLLMHFNELIHFLPAAVGILGLALAALHMRLRASAIGPAIAVHTAYNFVISALSVLYSFLQS